MRLCNVRLTALFAISANIMFLCDQASSILTVSALLALTTFLCGRYRSIVDPTKLQIFNSTNLFENEYLNYLTGFFFFFFWGGGGGGYSSQPPSVTPDFNLIYSLFRQVFPAKGRQWKETWTFSPSVCHVTAAPSAPRACLP